MSNSLSSPTRQRSKRVPTLRMLAAQTEWLQGRILWQDDHVVWEHARGRLRPGAADLSNAQRCRPTQEKARLLPGVLFLESGTIRGYRCIGD